MEQKKRELRKLSRTALMEVLVEQGREIDRLRAQIEAKNTEISSLKQEKQQLLDAVGSNTVDPRYAAMVAAAAMKINQMLENARMVLGDDKQ